MSAILVAAGVTLGVVGGMGYLTPDPNKGPSEEPSVGCNKCQVYTIHLNSLMFEKPEGVARGVYHV